MKSYDHYSETQELIDMLRKERLDNSADTLVNAMQEGATGTEIFMALRWNVKNILDEKKCSRLTEAKAKRLYRQLDEALK